MKMLNVKYGFFMLLLYLSFIMIIYVTAVFILTIFGGCAAVYVKGRILFWNY